MEDVLTGCGQSGHGPSMEGIDEGDDGISSISILVIGIFPCPFDGTFIGFGSGIGEEDFFHACLFADHFGQIGHGL